MTEIALGETVFPAVRPDQCDSSTNARNLSSLRMNLDFSITQVYTEFLLLLRRELLVSEEDDRAFSNEKCELVSLLVV